VRVLATPWPDRVLVISNLDSHEEWFTSEELEIANSFRLAKRRNEWLLSRVAAKQLAMQLGIVDDPRACVIERPRFREFHISFSHSHLYAGAALSRDPIGIDVQVVREFPENAVHLFLAPNEEEAMRHCTTAHRALHFWCAKEAAWKKRGGTIPTLKQVPLHVTSQTETTVTFDEAESVQLGDVIVALTV
jgi:phosphopantetheinyl transferase